MSVLKNKRKTSQLEFMHNAYQIRRAFTDLLLRDFGTREKVRTSKFYAKINHMDSEDQETFLGLTDKYHISTVVDEYPTWIIDDMRDRILGEIRFLIRNITQANSIFPTSQAECADRRRYQTAAIGCCEQIIQEMQYVVETLKVDINKYLPFIDMVEREIALLRGWRKSDNRRLTAIKEKEAKEQAKQELEVVRLREELETSGEIDEENVTKKPTATKSKNKSRKSKSSHQTTHQEG